MNETKPTEEELAAVVVSWLEALGADVYQEVELHTQGPRCDIVAVLGSEVWIVETKTSMSLALIEQAMERRRSAHRIFIATPVGIRGRGGADLCKELGIGVLSVHVRGEQTWTSDGYRYDPMVREIEPSRRWNSRPVRLRARLQPEHKTHARAGAQTGGHWTPFRSTCEQLSRQVACSPGISLKDAIDGIKHHYRSNAGARASMATWIREGKVVGVRIENGALYPAVSP